MGKFRGRILGRGDREVGELVERLRGISYPLREDADLDPLLERIGDARCVLLGEASHGTHEYYEWRARITQRLIREKGFSFVAVEGDWPDCYWVNRYVKGYPDSGTDVRKVLRVFERWPTWMWANEEVAGLIGDLRRHNDGLPPEDRVGFYGLDVYSLRESMEAILRFLERVDPDAVPTARRAYRCFEPYASNPQEYAWATAFVPNSCEEEALAMLSELRGRLPEYEGDPEAAFDADQNALVVKNAENYYRSMLRGSASSWNVRDRHMDETLDRLLRHHGPDSKAIVWEHNTHVGDARYTDMADAGMVNVGQLVRERLGEENVVIVGFGSHRGTVIASHEWGAPMERMPMPEARAGSWENLLHLVGNEDKLLVFDGGAEGQDNLMEPRAHRAIGVVYDPSYERFGNYVPTVLPRRYDAFLYLDETHALRPLHVEPRESGEVPETFPFGQ